MPNDNPTTSGLSPMSEAAMADAIPSPREGRPLDKNEILEEIAVQLQRLGDIQELDLLRSKRPNSTEAQSLHRARIDMLEARMVARWRAGG